MKAIYIGGSRPKTKGGASWKIYLYLFLFLAFMAGTLKMTGTMIVEHWLNRMGSDAHGYAFSIRDVDLSLSQGKLTLNDVKVINPKTSTELLEAPHLTIQLNLVDCLQTHENKISVSADKVDVVLSKDMSSELERIKSAAAKEKSDLYLDKIEGKIAKLNIVEKKDDKTRIVLELSEVDLKIKDISLLSTNKKTQFSVSSKVSDGGKLFLTGKTTEENGQTPWTIHGSLKEVRADIFNKIAGDKLPFSFFETKLTAEINARSEEGRVKGEFSPDIKRLNLHEGSPGAPTRSIARALTDELTFTLPFILKDDFRLEYLETYKKLKAYRKYPATNPQSVAKTSSSLWPF
jgi:hypothetical protein